MASNFFIELSLIIIAAVVILGIIRIFKQPLILGYILTGILFSPSVFNIIKSTEIISVFSEIGVVLLLFTVGLNLNPKIIKEVGTVSIFTGIIQVILTMAGGYAISFYLLNLDKITSVYISVALAFSSTVIILKLLSDKEDLNKLYGKISIGILIVQDILVILALILVTSLSKGLTITELALTTFSKGAGLIIILFLFGFFILPKITKQVAKSQEYLLLFSLGWCFAIATLFATLGFSIEIGALLAGVTLSISPYKIEVFSKLRPIRDFFLFIFFIWLGSQMSFSNISGQIKSIIILSIFVLIGKPIFIIILTSLFKHKKQTSFLTGISLAQISEFSLILVALGVKVGHIKVETLSLVTIIGLITISISSYFIMFSEKIYPIFSKPLSFIERKSSKEKELKEKKYKIIVFGSNRTGHSILKSLEDKKDSILIVDHDPENIEKLKNKGYNCIYGDISDPDLLLEIDVCSAKMIISTITNMDANTLFIKRTKLCNNKAIIIATTEHTIDALTLYDSGVDYVILPHHLGGKYAGKLIKKNEFSIKKYKKLKEEEIPEMKRIIKEKIN